MWNRMMAWKVKEVRVSDRRLQFSSTGLLPDKQEFKVRIEAPIETTRLPPKWHPIKVPYIVNRVPFGMPAPRTTA
jgi:hypothetical protein